MTELSKNPFNEGNVGIRLERFRVALQQEQQKENPDDTVVRELMFEIERHEQNEKELGITMALTTGLKVNWQEKEEAKALELEIEQFNAVIEQNERTIASLNEAIKKAESAK